MKRLYPVLLVCLTVVVLPFGCSGADEVTGPQLPELMPKKVPMDPPAARMQPVVVERTRAPAAASERPRESLPTLDPTPAPTPRVPPCWKNPENCSGV
jgi:hypothetical protein